MEPNTAAPNLPSGTIITRTTRISRLTSVLKLRFSMFCQCTGLHGWNFLAESGRGAFHVTFWLTVIVLSTISACFLVFGNIAEFADSSVSYDLATPTHPLEDVFFPSLVMCNFNRLRSSFVWALVNDGSLGNASYLEIRQLVERTFIKGQNLDLSASELAMVDNIMKSPTVDDMFDDLWQDASQVRPNATLSNLPIFNYHPVQEVDNETMDREKEKRDFLLNLASQYRQGEMILRLHFSGFGHIMDLGFASDVSDTCAWITPLTVEPSRLEYNYVRKYARNGINNGLKILLDAEVFDYASPFESKEGFVFTVLHHLDIAILKQTGSTAMPGQAVQVAITPTLTNTVESTKRRFSPKDRQCYFEDEIQLAHLPSDIGYRYEMSNCLYEAALQKIGKECNCIPTSFAKFLTTTLENCVGKMKLCMSSIMEDIGFERFIDDRGEKKECLATCEDQSHQFLVTTSAYPNEQSFFFGEDFCLVFDKLKKSCYNEKRFSLSLSYPKLCPSIEEAGSNVTCAEIVTQLRITTDMEGFELLKEQVAQYARKNLVNLDVFIRDPYVKFYVRREKITVISFVGTIGGLLGLFLGFSCMSIFEMVYVLIFGMSEKSFRFQRKGRVAPED